MALGCASHDWQGERDTRRGLWSEPILRATAPSERLLPSCERTLHHTRVSSVDSGPSNQPQILGTWRRSSTVSHCCVDDSEPSIPRPARHSQVIWLGKQYSYYPYRILAHLGSSLAIAIHDVLILMVCFLLLTRNSQCCDCFSLFIGVLT